MRRIHRQPLGEDDSSELARLSRQVAEAPSPKAKMEMSWKNKSRTKFESIRAVLISMAHGRARCMYCEDNMGTDIEHFWPKSTFPERAFSWPNYLWACSHCNSNEKRSKFPFAIDGKPLLIDPTVDEPRDHLRFLPSNGEFEPIGLRGEATIKVFGLNDDSMPRSLPTGRRRALNAIAALLRDYDRQIEQGDPEADETQGNLISYPFSSVLVWLVATAALPHAAAVLGPDICAILTRHRVAEWIPDVRPT